VFSELSPAATRQPAGHPLRGQTAQRVRPAPARLCWGCRFPAIPSPRRGRQPGSSWPQATSPASPMRALLAALAEPDTQCCRLRQTEARPQRRNGRGGWPWAKILAKPRARRSGRQQVNVVAGANRAWTDRDWVLSFAPNRTLHGPGPDPRRRLQTLPAPCPTWTGEAGASPRHPESCPAGGPEKPRLSRRALLNRFSFAGLLFATPWPPVGRALLGGALANLQRSTPALTLACQPSQPGIIARILCLAPNQNQRQDPMLMFTR